MTHPLLQSQNIFLKYSVPEILDRLGQLVTEDYVSCRPHPNYPQLRIFNYTDKCTYDKHWNELTLSARGLVFDIDSKRLVALPFPKIFNFSELGPIDLKSLPPVDSVVEKMDGSLGIVFFYDEVWNVATRGSFESEQARWATQRLREAIDQGLILEQNYTYLVEIIYEANRVVLHYPQEQLCLLSAFSLITFEEVPLIQYAKPFEDFALFTRPITYPFTSIQNMETLIKSLKDKEGVVVRFQDGTRIKFKTEEYCVLHRIKFGLTPLAVWEAMVEGTIEAYAVQVPEEFRTLFNSIHSTLQMYADTIRQDACMWLLTDNKNLLSRKELASELEKSKYPYRNIVWMLYDQKSNKEIDQSILKIIRPDGNIL
jgi:RNA ligase